MGRPLDKLLCLLKVEQRWRWTDGPVCTLLPLHGSRPLGTSMGHPGSSPHHGASQPGSGLTWMLIPPAMLYLFTWILSRAASFRWAHRWDAWSRRKLGNSPAMVLVGKSEATPNHRPTSAHTFSEHIQPHRRVNTCTHAHTLSEHLLGTVGGALQRLQHLQGQHSPERMRSPLETEQHSLTNSISQRPWSTPHKQHAGFFHKSRSTSSSQ